MNEEAKNNLAAQVMMNGWPRLQKIICRAYASGYEHGHHDTVEGGFWGNGDPNVHMGDAENWFNEAVVDGTFDWEREID